MHSLSTLGDTGVISGAILFIKGEFGLTPFAEELLVSAALLGAVCGATLSGRLTDLRRRKRTIFGTACLFARELAVDVWFWFIACLGARGWNCNAAGKSALILAAPPQRSGARVLSRIRPAEEITQEVKEILEHAEPGHHRLADLFSPMALRVLFVGIALAVIQQITEINTVIYY